MTSPLMYHKKDKLSVIDGLGHAETGILTDIDLVEHILGTFVREQERPEDCSQEAQRDRDDARVLQCEERLIKTHHGCSVFLCVNLRLGKSF